MNLNAIVQMILQQNPSLKNNMIVVQAMNKVQCGDITGLHQIAENLCKEKNVDINKQMISIKSQFGI